MKQTRKILFIAILVCIIQSPVFSNKEYAVMKLDGSVNPIMSDFIVKSINAASQRNVEFIVIQMDTPGGLVTSMQEIIKAIMNSTTPVVVFAYPKGAQAASAGGFIMLASHIAVMAPGTRIGAMHPVSPQLDFSKKDKKGKPGVSEQKVLNDIIAYAKSIAEKRKRNVNWAIRAIKNAESSTYKEALQKGVIDFVAEDMNDLIKKLNNKKVKLQSKTKILKTSKIIAVNYDMDWKQKFVNYFAQPQIVMMLLILAIAGIGIEFKSPGMIVPGVLGGISLILFLMAVRILPINIVGLILIITAIVLFILELTVPSFGLLTLGGIVAFVSGSLLMFDSPLPGGQVPLSTIIIVLLFLLAFIFLVVKAVLNVHKTNVTTGKEGLIGENGIATKDFSQGKGKIETHGELWSASSNDDIKKGDEVIVTGTKGMNLFVSKS